MMNKGRQSAQAKENNTVPAEPRSMDPQDWWEYYNALGRKWPEHMVEHFRKLASAIENPRPNTVGWYVKHNWSK